MTSPPCPWVRRILQSFRCALARRVTCSQTRATCLACSGSPTAAAAALAMLLATSTSHSRRPSIRTCTRPQRTKYLSVFRCTNRPSRQVCPPRDVDDGVGPEDAVRFPPLTPGSCSNRTHRHSMRARSCAALQVCAASYSRSAVAGVTLPPRSVCLQAGGSLDRYVAKFPPSIPRFSNSYVSTAVHSGVSCTRLLRPLLPACRRRRSAGVQLWLLNPQLSDAPHLVGTQQVLPIASLVMMPLLDAFDRLQPLRVGLVHVFDSKDTLHSVAALYVARRVRARGQ
jgi:hypothetical protein